jgi:hypothetical protein
MCNASAVAAVDGFEPVDMPLNDLDGFETRDA